MLSEMIREGAEKEREERSKNNGMFNALGKEIVKINKANGWNVTTPDDWNRVYKVPAVLGLIHSEVSEALEAFRNHDKINFKEEMADIIIRVLDCTTGLEIDIDKAITAKLAKNKKRGFRHGNKRV
jgi:NTP pyrophosphatase (non-canonical NTP hydrolase)